jgi:hypothetical protein
MRDSIHLNHGPKPFILVKDDCIYLVHLAHRLVLGWHNLSFLFCLLCTFRLSHLLYFSLACIGFNVNYDMLRAYLLFSFSCNPCLNHLTQEDTWYGSWSQVEDPPQEPKVG